MASIVNRGPYQFQVTVRRKGHPRQTKTFETEREAKDWAKLVEADMLRSVFKDRREVENMTLGELLSRYESEETPKKAGARQELSRLRILRRSNLACRILAELQASDFANYRDNRLTEVQANTVRLELSLLSAVFKKAGTEWSMPIENPLKKVIFPAVPAGRNRRLVDDEEDRLLAAARAAEASAEKLEAAILLAIETGIREERLATLKWSQVDLNQGVVWVMTKAKLGEQERVPVPLSLKAVQILQRLPRQESPQVFGTAFPQGATLGDAFRRAKKRAKITDLNFHDLRHEAASRLAPHMTPTTLAKIMTWKTLAMAMRYYNPKPEELVQEIRAIESKKKNRLKQQAETVSGTQFGGCSSYSISASYTLGASVGARLPV